MTITAHLATCHYAMYVHPQWWQQTQLEQSSSCSFHGYSTAAAVSFTPHNNHRRRTRCASQQYAVTGGYDQTAHSDTGRRVINTARYTRMTIPQCSHTTTSSGNAMLGGQREHQPRSHRSMPTCTRLYMTDKPSMSKNSKTVRNYAHSVESRAKISAANKVSERG